MRKKIVAGNWKMNTNLQEGVALAKEINEALKAAQPKCDVIIAVPFTHLASINAVIDPAKLGLGAENCANHKSGAYTGEVSAPMVCFYRSYLRYSRSLGASSILRRNFRNPEGESCSCS